MGDIPPLFNTYLIKKEKKMAHIDNSKVFHEGTYADVTVKVPANTTYKEGTVLGRNSSGDLVAYSTANNVAATSTTAAFVTEPLYILAQDLINSTASAVEKNLVRVFDGGVVDVNKLIFVKSEDATTKTVLDDLKKNGFRLLNVENLIDETPLNN